MVSIQEVKEANLNLANKPAAKSLTAVFTGATSGIGKATLLAFARHISQPTAIIVGRSEKAFASELDNLRAINPKGDFTFLEADVSLIKGVDAVSQRIVAALQGRQIDFLCMSQGYLPFNGRETNADGFDNCISLRYYSRVRMTGNLLPHLSTHARVLSILAGGHEGKILEDDLDLEKNYTLAAVNNQFATMTTLAFDQLAKQNPDRAFLHVFPGIVSTGLFGRSAQGVMGLVVRWAVEPMMSLFATKPEDSGERMLHYLTRDEFAKGSLPLDSDGTVKEGDVLKEYRQRNFGEKVMEHTHAMFDRATKK